MGAPLQGCTKNDDKKIMDHFSIIKHGVKISSRRRNVSCVEYNLERQNESEKRSRRGLLKKDQGEEREIEDTKADGAKNGRMLEPMGHGPSVRPVRRVFSVVTAGGSPTDMWAPRAWVPHGDEGAARDINTVADPTPVFPQRRRIPGSRL